MDQETLNLIEAARKTDPNLDKLFMTHQDLNDQVDKLNAQDHLSVSETQKLAELKKEKLRIRDLIEQAVHSDKSA